MKPKILFLCAGDSARSQMAEGYPRHVASDSFTAMSAGIEPKGLNPLAVEVMDEIGIDISNQCSKDVVSLLGQHIPYVVTYVTTPRSDAQYFPGTWRFLHWSFIDPAAVQGGRDEKLRAVREVRDQIIAQIDDAFVRGSALSRGA